ncbi:hypothetical protein [Streptococcus sp. sy010]|uniref:hypothetical protein n=1 Tax=Streptococcus sp. sy010 TaxID=2600148 RepID=UPI0011B7CF45|nr:hypothetical protein [Streptococcus sp. sy010]TWT14681.1 hypothetical protein FRX51_03680 [Streptococcus sp. sy010]
MTREENLPFDKGFCPTGVYITAPDRYSVHIGFAETLPVDLKEEHYEWYKGSLVCLDGFDPYAFQSRDEVDQHIAATGAKFWTFDTLEDYHAYLKDEEERVKKERKILESKYGVPVSKVQDKHVD